MPRELQPAFDNLQLVGHQLATKPGFGNRSGQAFDKSAVGRHGCQMSRGSFSVPKPMGGGRGCAAYLPFGGAETSPSGSGCSGQQALAVLGECGPGAQ